MPPAPDDLSAAPERLINDTATAADLAALRRELLVAGEGNTVQIGKHNVHIGQGQNIQIGDRFYAILQPQTLTEDLARWSEEYLQAAVREWSTLRLDEAENAPQIPLTQVFVLLQAARQEPPRPLQPSPSDVLPTKDRLEHIGSPWGAETAPPPPPVPLGQALKAAQHLVLLGEPGAGKTTTLQFLGLCFAHTAEGWPQEKLGLDEKRIPIRLNLPGIVGDQVKLLDILAKAVEERLQCQPQQALALLERWSEDPGLLVLLDGLDEVPAEARERVRGAITVFAHSPPGQKARLVVASRTAGYVPLDESFQDYLLKPFSGPQEARDFMQHWLAALQEGWSPEQVEEKAAQLLQALEQQPALRRLDNPLQLRLCAEVFAKTGKVVRNRADLYEKYLQTLRTRARKRGVGEDELPRLHQAARCLAWHWQHGGGADEAEARQTLMKGDAFLKPLPSEDEASALLEALRQKVGLLVRVSGLGLSLPQLAFSHQTLREYLVAERLREAWKQDPRRVWRFLQPRLHLPEWREPLLLLVSGMEPQQAERFIRRVQDGRSSYERRLRRGRRLAIALSAERGEAALPLQALRDKEWWVREAAAEALGKIGAPAVPVLLQALRDEYEDVREAAAEALGEIGAPAVPGLLGALRDKEWWVREAAAEALGKIGAPAVPGLLEALRDKEWWVRRAAAWALGKIGDSQAVPGLLEALGEIGAPAVPGLLKALRYKEWWMRRAAARALGKIGDPEAVPGLLKALRDDEEGWVRWAAVRALGEIGDPQAVPGLLGAMRDDEEGWVRESAAWALGKIGAPAVPGLLKALRDDEEGWVRRAAAEVLGEIGDPEAVPGLLKALRDKERWVRESAAWALGKIGAPAVPGLLGALGKIGAPAVPGLLGALRDKDEVVRRAAAAVLGKVGDPEAVPGLIQALRDEHVGVRWAAAAALGKVGDPEAVPGLIQALRDEYENVRRAAAEALSSILQSGPTPPEAQARRVEETRRLRSWAERVDRILQTQDDNARQVLEAILLRLERLEAAESAGLLEAPSRWQRWREAVLGILAALGVGLVALLGILAAGAGTRLEEALQSFWKSQPLGVVVLAVLLLAILGALLTRMVERWKR